MKKSALILALLVTVLSFTGCGMGGKSVTIGHWNMTIPSDWKEVPPSPGGKWEKAYDADGMHIEIAGKSGDAPMSRAALAEFNFRGQVQSKGFKNQGIEDLKIKGATESAIQRFTFVDKSGKPQQGAWIVGTQWPYPSSAAIAISSTNGQLDPAKVDSLIKSLSWKKIEK